MKIQDIFKIDINSKGGGKLFQRIMNRYGIPKQDSVELKDNVNNSSSSGGSKVEYYKTNVDLKESNLDRFVYTMCVLFKGVGTESNELDIANAYTVLDAMSNQREYFISTQACAFLPLRLNDERYDSFINVMYYALSQLNPNLSKEEFTQGFDMLFTPITEEEFYNLD